MNSHAEAPLSRPSVTGPAVPSRSASMGSAWAVLCSASKVATSKPTNSLSLRDASGHTLVVNRGWPFVADVAAKDVTAAFAALG
jgi:hypothetical protein